MSEAVVTVSDLVADRQGRVRWAVTATFVGIDGNEPRCVDYRVRVVPHEPRTPVSGERLRNLVAAHEVLEDMERNVISSASAERLGTVPPEGIPRYVFERASQARLLAKARQSTERRPDRFDDATVNLLARALPSRQGRVRVGRPPSRSLGEKLAILAEVADEYAAGTRGARALVAERHHMSESALSDLLKWARHTANPPLFTHDGPGLRTDRLTDAAKALIERGAD